MNFFHLTITSPEKLVFDGNVTSCRVHTLSGKLGIEPRHEPIIAVLKEGSSVFYNTTSRDDGTVQVKSGIISFQKNKCIITGEISPTG